MRTISDHVKDLIEQLRHTELRDDIWIQIAKAGEPAVISDLLYFVRSDENVTPASAAGVVQELLKLVRPSQLPELDEKLRSISAGYRGYIGADYKDPWFGMNREDVGHLSRMNGNVAGLLGLASSHCNGYVRQAALEHLQTEWSGIELPFVILRANDWVQPVRALAQSMLMKRITASYAAHLVRNAPLIARMLLTARSDQSHFVEKIKSLLWRPDCREHLYSGMDSADPATRRICFRWAMEPDAEPSIAVIKRGMRTEDTVVNIDATRAVRSMPDSADRQELLQSLQRSRVPRIRRECLYAAAEQTTPDALLTLKSFLLDSNRAIREAARFYISRKEGCDYREFYRSVIMGAKTSPPATAVLGLGETGAKDDVDLLVPILSSPADRVVKAAIVALNQLDGEAQASRLFVYVSNQNPGVSSSATTALADKVSHIRSDDLWRLVDSGERMHVRLNALKLINRLNQWDKLSFILRACAIDDQIVAAKAREYSAHWLRDYNYLLKPRDQQQMELIAKTLKSYKNQLEPAVEIGIRRLISDF